MQWPLIRSNKLKHHTNIYYLEWQPMPSSDKPGPLVTKSVWHTHHIVVVFTKMEVVKQEERMWMTGRWSLCKSTLRSGGWSGVLDSNSWHRHLFHSRCASKHSTLSYLCVIRTMWWSCLTHDFRMDYECRLNNYLTFLLLTILILPSLQDWWTAEFVIF
jgi:hypothetical protein